MSGIIAPAWCVIEKTCVSKHTCRCNGRRPPHMPQRFRLRFLSEHLATASKANLRKASPIAQRKPAIIVRGLHLAMDLHERALQSCYNATLWMCLL